MRNRCTRAVPNGNNSKCIPERWHPKSLLMVQSPMHDVTRERGRRANATSIIQDTFPPSLQRYIAECESSKSWDTAAFACIHIPTVGRRDLYLSENLRGTKDHLKIRILRSGSKAQGKEDSRNPETMVRRILMFMWSVGPRETSRALEASVLANGSANGVRR